jgi:hypothetical protein
MTVDLYACESKRNVIHILTVNTRVEDARGSLVRDMGTHESPPTRVLEVHVKWTRPARSPTDLQVGPKTLSTIPTTMKDLGRTYPNSGRPAGLVEQASS